MDLSPGVGHSQRRLLHDAAYGGQLLAGSGLHHVDAPDAPLHPMRLRRVHVHVRHGRVADGQERRRHGDGGLGSSGRAYGRNDLFAIRHYRGKVPMVILLFSF